MRRRHWPLAALGVAWLALSQPTADAASCGISGRTPDEQAELIAKFDAYLARARARDGLGNVRFSRSLSVIAEDYAHLLDAHDHFDHTGPDGSTPATRMKAAGYCYRFVAENLAMGGFEDAEELFQAWWDSIGHRKNMMHDTPTVYGLAANCPPRPKAAGNDGLPTGSLASLMEKDGALKDAVIDPTAPVNQNPEVFVMLLAEPC